MDYLTLCQKFRSKAGIQGTGPVTVISQSGEYARIVDWIQEAWEKIQDLPFDWKWMWREYPLALVQNTPDYVLTDVEEIHKKTFTIYKTSLGVTDKSRVTYIDWDGFQRRFETSTSTSDRPSFVTRLPNGNLRFEPAPDAVYTVGFEYQKTAQILAANTDTPELPVRFHSMILFRALIDHGGYEEAGDVYKYAVGEYEKYERNLLFQQKLVRSDQMVVRAG